MSSSWRTRSQCPERAATPATHRNAGSLHGRLSCSGSVRQGDRRNGEPARRMAAGAGRSSDGQAGGQVVASAAAQGRDPHHRSASSAHTQVRRPSRAGAAKVCAERTDGSTRPTGWMEFRNEARSFLPAHLLTKHDRTPHHRQHPRKSYGPAVLTVQVAASPFNRRHYQFLVTGQFCSVDKCPLRRDF
jgi:hypothetical protein